MLAALVYIVGCTGTTVSLYQTSITVSPASATVQLGQSTVFTANVNTQSLSSTAVTWQVNGVTGGSTTLGTISASGLYTAPLAMPASSSVTITAIAQADTTKSASAIITLTQPPTSVSIAPLTATVQLGLTQTFTATVINDLQNKGVLWQVNGITGGSTTLGTISTTGLYTAPLATPASSTVTINAIAQADTTKSASATVILAQPPISVSIIPLTASVQLGLTQTFTATVVNDLQNKGVLWQVNGITGGNTTLGTISTTGLYTAPLAIPASSTITITAVAQADTTKSASATVTLLALPISVTVSPTMATVQVLLTQAFTATLQNDLQSKGVTWDVNGTIGGNNTVGIVSTAGLYTAPANVPSPAIVTVTARSIADTTRSAAATVTVVPAPPSYDNLDRIDFGNATSETSHSFQGGDNSAQTEGTGAFSQTYRQPRLVVWPYAPAIPGEQLTFTMTVSPTLQNYVTVKLYGSDTEFGVLKVLQFGTVTPASGGNPAVANSPNGDADQLDNNNSSGGNNPPSYGLFHFTTLAIPQALTQGKTSVTMTLYSTGYYYSNGAGQGDNPTRPVYSAFTHTNPYFVPPATDAQGTPLVVTGYTPPTAITQADVNYWELYNRGAIFQPGNQYNNNGFFHPGGFLEHDGICTLPANTPGMPAEVVGLSVSNMSYNGQNFSEQPVGGQPLYGPPAPCLINQAAIAAVNASASPADTWRNLFGETGSGQSGSVDVDLGVYLLPPLMQNGAVMKGFDDYHDPALLQKIVGLLDGMTRMQGSGGSWSNGCHNDFNSSWAGITTTPRQTGTWTGSSARQDAGCISFDGPNVATLNTAILRLLNDSTAAPLFQQYLSASFDANLNGNPQPRAYAYERMLYYSKDQMFFDPVKASTSNNYFDKANVTVTQALIQQQEAYSGQLALRALLALYPNSDSAAQPLDTTLMTSIVEQELGLTDPIVFDPVGVDWRLITAAGLGESHGTLSSGYDGRYGSYEAPGTGGLVYFTQWDTTLTAAQKQQFASVPINCISAYDHFLYPQQSVTYDSTGKATAHWTFSQEDVISYRVPYGPNADGANTNWFVQLQAADPNGPIRSPYALRSFFFGSLQNFGADASGFGISSYPLIESLWSSLIGASPSNFPALPAESGQPDFVWADIQDGAVSIQYQGEHLFINSQYNRPDGGFNNLARLHYVTPTLDREGLVMMPYDTTTMQNDGNLSGNGSGTWIVHYGKYLVVLNNTTGAYPTTLPAGLGVVHSIVGQATLPMGSTQMVPASSYEVFVLPQ